MIVDEVARGIVAGSALVATPLLLRACGRDVRVVCVAVATGALAGAALLVPAGAAAGLLVAPYTLVCWWLAAVAAAGVVARGWRPVSELVGALALVYLGGAALWLASARVGVELLGYPPLWVLLTAAHFHVAGAYLCGVAALHARGGGAVAAAVALVVALAIPLTAAGIHGPRWLETGAALATAAGGVGVAMLSLRAAVRPGRRAARSLHAIAGISLLVAMALAATYALRAYVPTFTVAGLDPLSSMAITHGVLDGAGFALAALAAFALAPPRPAPPFAPPFSHLSAGWRVGADFFASRSLERTPPTAPRGLVDDLDELAHPGLDPSVVAPAIRAFYERTHDHALIVRPHWRAGFRTAARLWARIARRLGQLELPIDAERGDEGITSRIVAIDAAADGRPAPRAWIRTFADGRAMYVAAYATHVTAGVAYMNIAFPLPGGHLASILRLDPLAGSGGAVELSTRTGGDAGIWLCVRGFGRTWPLRLPLAETIRVWTRDDAAAPAELRALAPVAATSIARHDLWLCGLHYLTLDYAMTPLPGSAGQHFLRSQHRGRPLPDAELLVEPEQPALDRAGADPERLGDLVIGEARPQVGEQAGVGDLQAEPARELLGDLPAARPRGDGQLDQDRARPGQGAGPDPDRELAVDQPLEGVAVTLDLGPEARQGHGQPRRHDAQRTVQHRARAGVHVHGPRRGVGDHDPDLGALQHRQEEVHGGGRTLGRAGPHGGAVNRDGGQWWEGLQHGSPLFTRRAVK